MGNMLKENGTDEAVIAIKRYFDNNGQLDEEYFTDNVKLTLDNTERLVNDIKNNRVKPYGPAYEAMLEMFKIDGHELSSRQVQAGFKKLGLDYKKVLEPVVEYVKEQRNEKSLNEDKNENLVKSSHVEDMGGHTMAVYGQLENGQYFAGNEDGLNFYDIDVWPLYTEDPDDVDWEKIDDEHKKDSVDGDSKEYYEIIKQTKFFDENELEDLKNQVYGIEEDLEPLEDFIQGLVDDFDNITTSDLQGIVDARCMQTHEDENEILDEIYKRVSELNECLINEAAIDRYQVREFEGPGANFGVYDTKEKKFVQKGSKKIMIAACDDLNNKNSIKTEGKENEIIELGNNFQTILDKDTNSYIILYKYSEIDSSLKDDEYYEACKTLDGVKNFVKKLKLQTTGKGFVKKSRIVKESDEDSFEDLELNTDEPEDLELEPRDLDKENDAEELEPQVEENPETDIASEVNSANQEVNTELENNDYTMADLINGVKSLVDSEKESITMYNEFLANFAAKTPKDVYEIIENYINEIKDTKLDEQTKLNNLYDALNSYAKSNEDEDRTEELVDEVPEGEEPIVADDNDEIFNSLAEEGKLVVTNFDTLAEKYAACKGIENNKELKLEVRKSLLNNYKILEDKQYVFISKKLIENRLLAEEKKEQQIKELEKVKAEAEQNAKESGEDTYVYQSTIDGTMFFATQKPTHTALFNKVLVLGKYKVSFNHGEVSATWLKESKQNYKYKRNLNEGTLQDNKTIEDEYNSDAIKEIEKEASKNNEKQIPKGTEVESPVGGNGIVTEAKDSEVIEEIAQDYEKLTIDEFKKRNKDYIDLVYKNTWGEGEIDKDLYNDIVNTMYNDSITGNINTKSDYESLNDKIEKSNIKTINNEVK